MTNKNIETVQRIDFDRLDMLVSERIGALTQFLESVKLDEVPK